MIKGDVLISQSLALLIKYQMFLHGFYRECIIILFLLDILNQRYTYY